MTRRDDFELARAAFGRAAARLEARGLDPAAVSRAALDLGAGRLIAQRGNLAVAGELERAARSLRRRPAVLVADMRPEGHA